jgi:HEAT repeat protein
MLCYQLLFNADVIIQSNVEEILVNLDDLFARSIVTCHLENDKVNQDEIIILLGTLKSKDSLGLITNKITDKNLTDTVLWAFGTIGAAESIPEIMKFLGDEAHGFEAAIAISRMEHQEKTIPLLLNALDEPNETLKKNAAYALFSIAIEYKRMPVERLIQHLNNKSPEVREYMALALGEIGDPQALEALKKAAKDKNRAVREAASRAILEIMGE